MKKYLILTLMISILFISFSSALEGHQQNKDYSFEQTVANADSCNITKITYPDKTISTLNLQLNKDGFSFTKILGSGNFSQLGETCWSIICYDSDADPQYISGKKCVEVTPSGNNGVDNIIYIIILLVLLYGLTLIFFLKREIALAPFTALSGMALGSLGIYIVTNGLVIYQDWITNYLSYVTIGVGFGLGLWSLIEWIEDLL